LFVQRIAERVPEPKNNRDVIHFSVVPQIPAELFASLNFLVVDLKRQILNL